MTSKTVDKNKTLHSLNNYLKTVKATSIVIKKITKVLLILTNKRKTIAERAIQAELICLVSLESQLITSLTQSLTDEKYFLDDKDCQKLRQINIRLNKQLQAFIKAATYNLNYLEQYFEHDFWIKLDNNNFAQELSYLVEKISVSAC